ncbi:Uncharacterized protein APZ42_001955 [Daphnia magna]|uniref:Uncharacterized protein n=1 Tax=Daphnia magna TaxID=35525 RepID=A0A164IM71_9CRUS|nr:Uncharacterized protein APZ42_001955 [Daphnia magna]
MAVVNPLVVALQNQMLGGIAPSLPFSVDRQIERYMDAAGVERDETGVAFVALSHALSTLLPDCVSDMSPQVWQFEFVPQAAAQAAAAPAARAGASAGAAADQYALSVAGIGNMPVAANDIKIFLRSVLASLDRNVMWLVTLAACHQVSSLNAKNVAREDIIGNNVYNVVMNSRHSYWSREHNELIPIRLRGVAAVWAKVYGRDYGEWKQGEAGLNSLAPNEVLMWRSIFTKMKSSQSTRIM